MAPMDQVVKKVLDKGKPNLKDVEFLSVKAAAALLGASEKIIYSLIHSGKLHATNLFALPEQPTIIQPRPAVADCYHMAEAQVIYNISEKALFDLIKRNNISKFQEGKFTYVAKADLDRIFNPTI